MRLPRLPREAAIQLLHASPQRQFLGLATVSSLPLSSPVIAYWRCAERQAAGNTSFTGTIISMSSDKVTNFDFISFANELAEAIFSEKSLFNPSAQLADLFTTQPLQLFNRSSPLRRTIPEASSSNCRRQRPIRLEVTNQALTATTTSPKCSLHDVSSLMVMVYVHIFRLIQIESPMPRLKSVSGRFS